MTTLKEEKPFAAVVHTEFLNITCSFCFAFQKNVKKCTGCKVVCYCNQKCQKGDWVNHKYECYLLRREFEDCNNVADGYARLAARILIKDDEDLVKEAFNGRTWNSLKDHVEDVKAEHEEEFNSLVSFLFFYMKRYLAFRRLEIASALSKVIYHSMGIFDSKHSLNIVGIGLYLGLSVHPHSCLPDSQIIFTGSKASLRCFDRMRSNYSEGLTLSYTVMPKWVRERGQRMKKIYFYGCTCPLCSDKNHIINQMGASCYVSCCQDAAGIKDVNSLGPYKCNKCGTISPITVEDVNQAETKIERFASELSLTLVVSDDFMEALASAMETLLSSERILSVYNFRFIGLCCSIMMMTLPRGLHGTGRYANEKAIKAFEYYLHDTDIVRLTALMHRSTLKQLLNRGDDFDTTKVIKQLILTFGERHPVVFEFMSVMGQLMMMGSKKIAELNIPEKMLSNCQL